MTGIARQPLCSCGAQVTAPRLRYCSQECYRAAERERRRRYEHDPRRIANRRKRQRAQYAAIKADPDRWAKRQAYQREYARTHREKMREYDRRWHEQLRQDPERLAAMLKAERERKRAWSTANPEVRLQRGRESYRRMRRDARRWAVRLEHARMSYRLRAERNGHPVPPVPEERYPAASSQWTIGAEPLREVVAEVTGNGGTTLADLARAAGVSERLVYRLLHEDGRVSVAAADRLLVALGLHLDLIYSEEVTL